MIEEKHQSKKKNTGKINIFNRISGLYEYHLVDLLHHSFSTEHEIVSMNQQLSRINWTFPLIIVSNSFLRFPYFIPTVFVISFCIITQASFVAQIYTKGTNASCVFLFTIQEEMESQIKSFLWLLYSESSSYQHRDINLGAGFKSSSPWCECFNAAVILHRLGPFYFLPVSFPAIIPSSETHHIISRFGPLPWSMHLLL